jgi:hypothetical protein
MFGRFDALLSVGKNDELMIALIDVIPSSVIASLENRLIDFSGKVYIDLALHNGINAFDRFIVFNISKDIKDRDGIARGIVDRASVKITDANSIPLVVIEASNSYFIKHSKLTANYIINENENIVSLILGGEGRHR